MSALAAVLVAALLFAAFAYGALRFGAVERAGASCGGSGGDRDEGACGLCAMFGTPACGRSNHHESDEPDGDAARAARSCT